MVSISSKTVPTLGSESSFISQRDCDEVATLLLCPNDSFNEPARKRLKGAAAVIFSGCKSTQRGTPSSPHGTLKPETQSHHIGSHTPIFRLAPELMQAIFMMCMPVELGYETMAMPNTLMHVCKRWKNIVVDDPLMWASIYHSRKTPFRSFAKACLISPSMAVLRLRRSKRIPLEISMSLRGREDIPLILILISAAARWRSCQIDLWPDHQLGTLGRNFLHTHGLESWIEEDAKAAPETVGQVVWDDLLNLPTPEYHLVASPAFRRTLPKTAAMLEQLSISSYGRASDLTRWFNSLAAGAPRLRNLQWGGIPISHNPSLWSRMQHLSLKSAQLTPHHALIILRSAPQLIEVDFDLKPVALSAQHNTGLHHPTLRILKLRSSDLLNVLNFLQLPALEELSLSVQSWPGDHLNACMDRSSCHLTSFSLQMSLSQVHPGIRSHLARFLFHPGVNKSIERISIEGHSIITNDFLELFIIDEPQWAPTRTTAATALEPIRVPVPFPRLNELRFVHRLTLASGHHNLLRMVETRKRAGLALNVIRDTVFV